MEARESPVSEEHEMGKLSPIGSPPGAVSMFDILPVEEQAAGGAAAARGGSELHQRRQRQAQRRDRAQEEIGKYRKHQQALSKVISKSGSPHSAAAVRGPGLQHGAGSGHQEAGEGGEALGGGGQEPEEHGIGDNALPFQAWGVP